MKEVESKTVVGIDRSTAGAIKTGLGGTATYVTIGPSSDQFPAEFPAWIWNADCTPSVRPLTVVESVDPVIVWTSVPSLYKRYPLTPKGASVAPVQVRTADVLLAADADSVLPLGHMGISGLVTVMSRCVPMIVPSVTVIDWVPAVRSTREGNVLIPRSAAENAVAPGSVAFASDEVNCTVPW